MQLKGYKGALFRLQLVLENQWFMEDFLMKLLISIYFKVQRENQPIFASRDAVLLADLSYGKHFLSCL